MYSLNKEKFYKETCISIGLYHSGLKKQYHILQNWVSPWKSCTAQFLKAENKKILLEVIIPSEQRVKEYRNLPLSAVKEYRGFSGRFRAPDSLSLECGDRDDGAGSKRFELACKSEDKSESEE